MIKRINLYLNKLAIYCFCIFRIFSNKILKPSKNEKNIVIVFGQSLGDNILFLDALRRLRDHYSRKDGYHIYLVGFDNVISFYKKCTDCDIDEFIIADKDFSFITKTPKFIPFIKLLSLINKYKPEVVINNFNSAMSVAITAGIVCKMKYAMSFDITGVNTSFFLKYIRNHCANNIVKIGEFEMLFSGYKKLVRSVGVSDYKTQLGKINNCELTEIVKRKYNINNAYCVIVADSNEKPKNWEIGKFIEVSKYIINNTNLQIIYTGNNRDSALKQFINDEYYKNRIIDCIRKTTLEELMQLVSGADFIFGNDTGTIHLAAAIGTKSIFVSTYKDIGRCHPYQLEKVNDDDEIPIGIWCNNKPQCEGCNITPSARRIIWKNKQCKHNYKLGKPLKCLSDISVQNVIKILNCKIFIQK